MENIIVQKLEVSHISWFKELLFLFEDVFEMENFVLPEDTWLMNLLRKDNFLVFAALYEEQVAGGLTVYILDQYYSKRPLAYIFDLAVKTEFQRKGIGRKLISETAAYCREAGMEEIFVQADLEDGHALEFYRAMGGIPESVVHYSYSLNKD